MYNDAWGEVGWTIIDYYLRRKIPFYGVKRALAHKKFTLRMVDNRVVLQGLNDTPQEIEVRGRFGYVSFDGKVDKTREVSFVLPPHSRAYVLEEEPGDYDMLSGTYMLYVDHEEIDNISLRMEDNRKLRYEQSQVQVLEMKDADADRLITLTSAGYVHGVYVKGDLDCSDNYFDLLPGETKTIRVKGAKGKALSVGAVR